MDTLLEIHRLIDRGVNTRRLLSQSGRVPKVEGGYFKKCRSHTGIGGMCQVLENLGWVSITKVGNTKVMYVQPHHRQPDRRELIEVIATVRLEVLLRGI
ncbi:hypothetical protein SEA_NODIGI_50 [Gordonia phage Nodigi]|nr:hypothetical protein SEA_NODIGI_50 [Gordonia phage Nodigi]